MRHLKLFETFSNDRAWLVQFERFLDHPWQEDTEINIVVQLSEYRDKFKSDPTGAHDYFNRWNKENRQIIDGSQMVSDNFMSEYNNLLGGVNEAKKVKTKTMKDMSYSEKIAVYRDKISAERKNPTPDQSKIETFKSKISALDIKKKKNKS